MLQLLTSKSAFLEDEEVLLKDAVAEEGIERFLDQSSFWDLEIAKKLEKVALDCLKAKKFRPDMKQVMEVFFFIVLKINFFNYFFPLRCLRILERKPNNLEQC